MSIVFILNFGIVIITLVFLAFFIPDLMKHKDELKDGSTKRTIGGSIIAIVTLFFDTLGIGSFAPMTACYKGFKLVPDKLIPGTLNACILTTSVEAIYFINTIEVETKTLVCLIAAATIGAFIGAGLVSKLPLRQMRLGMGAALVFVAIIMFLGQMEMLPVGGEALGLSGTKLIIGTVLCFIFGALMTIGVGAFAPIMSTVYLLGLSPVIAFPIMMGACAYLMPAAAIRFVKSGVYDRKMTLINNTLGLIGVAIACFVITSIPLYALKWVVVVVVTYTAVVMLKDGLRTKAGPSVSE